MFEVFNYKGNSFTVFESEEEFIVVVNEETYELNSLADVNEFIRYYNN